jgi:acetyl-CoA C-acetyltransferase
MAFQRAGLASIHEIHGIDVHDCFSISELIAYEVLGLAKPGEGRQLLLSGATMLPQIRSAHFSGVTPPFAIPVNPGGGLIGDGHPVGATGVRQVCEAFAHLTNSAGDRQIPGAKRYLTYNVGGSMTTVVTTIWERA